MITIGGVRRPMYLVYQYKLLSIFSVLEREILSLQITSKHILSTLFHHFFPGEGLQTPHVLERYLIPPKPPMGGAKDLSFFKNLQNVQRICGGGGAPLVPVTVISIITVFITLSPLLMLIMILKRVMGIIIS